MSDDILKIFHMDMNFVSLNQAYIRKWLKKLADMGYNAILWELENKVAWETCPECVWPEAMSKAEFKSILEYSRELGLEPVPLLQTIGHGEYVMLHEKYHHFRENPERHDCYCTSNPEVRAFLKQWIGEYLELFGEIRFFHLGGDEAYEFGGCPVCSEYARKNGRNKLYSEHILDLAEPLLSKGIRPGIWADMVLHHPDKMTDIPKDFVLWDWNYSGSDVKNDRVNVWGQGAVEQQNLTSEIMEKFPCIVGNDGKLNPFYTCDFLRALGYDAILCSSSRSAGDTNYCGRHGIHSENIVGCARKSVQAGLLGTCVTSWAIRLHSFESQEQWLMLAPLTIDNPEMSYQELIELAGKILFGVNAADFYTAISLIGSVYLFNMSHHVGIQWTDLKDSLPAPENFISGLLEKMRSGDYHWDNREKMLSEAAVNIPRGIELLNQFALRAVSGRDVIWNWSVIAQGQFWHLKLSEAVVAKAESGKPASEDILNMLEELRAMFSGIAKFSQTPKSAELNTGLVFDAITEYLRS